MRIGWKQVEAVEPALREVVSKYTVNGHIAWKEVLPTAPEAEPLRAAGITGEHGGTLYSYCHNRGIIKPRVGVVGPARPKPRRSYKRKAAVVHPPKAEVSGVNFCPQCGCNLAAVAVAISL
jgi:hypothetical protein